MTVKDLVRLLPGIRPLLLFRHQIRFRSSTAYWERRYARGGTSGVGSYGDLATGKAAFLNDFVRSHDIRSVIEFGCGDGNQLSLADYPTYVGLDVSRYAVERCACRYADDPTKSFYLYDGTCFADHARLFTADLALSLDVIYHLTEDADFEAYMRHLFAAGRRFVIIYGTNREISDVAPHVRHRPFSRWVDRNCPDCHLVQVTSGPGSGPGRADFFIYERVTRSGPYRATGAFPVIRKAGAQV